MTPEERLAQALADYHDALARGETVDAEDFCRRHPDIDSELRGELETAGCVEELLEAPAEELPERLSGHKILGEIGSGGMGRVLLAFDAGLGRKVAIKTLNRRYRNHPQLRARFMQEARAMARLSHPNVVHIYNLGPADELPHFVMEYLEGAPLTQAGQALSVRQKVELMLKVVRAVEFLHKHHVIHRDLKPGNLLVGSDLEPKVLDFGLAVQVDDAQRLTLAGEVMGTPAYFSPEQTRGVADLDARSDIFSLGAVFYELLTGALPFPAANLAEQVRSIREQDPALPRRVNSAIPGELQNICLKALEKNPVDRYASAREMAEDLERYLAGEAVLAAPTHYSRLMAGKIEQHLRELDGWRQDHVLSESEYDAFRKCYDRLTEREDAWIMEVRRLSLPQVSLYLGAWILSVGASLILLFYYARLSPIAAVAVVAAAAAPTGWLGIRCWKAGQLRTGVAYLLAFCLLLPITLVVGMHAAGLFTAPTRGKEELEFFGKFSSFQRTTNAQLWWALVCSLPVYLWLRRFTHSNVFSLVVAVMGAVLSLVTLLRMGLLEWIDTDPGRVYLRMIPIALLFFAVAIALERFRRAADSRYFYPIAVAFTFAALSGVAAVHDPYANWLKSVAPWTRGQKEYLFILNAGYYLALHGLCERLATAHMRTVSKAFRFVIPGHVMTSLLLLGLDASGRWEKAPADAAARLEARTLEILLPIVACAFVYFSIPKQMKNYLATGLLFLAIGLVRLEQDLFKDRSVWPISLLVIGFLLMYAATHYTPIRMALIRMVKWKR